MCHFILKKVGAQVDAAQYINIRDSKQDFNNLIKRQLIDRFHAAQKADIKISVDDISHTLKTELSDSETKLQKWTKSSSK